MHSPISSQLFKVSDASSKEFVLEDIEDVSVVTDETVSLVSDTTLDSSSVISLSSGLTDITLPSELDLTPRPDKDPAVSINASGSDVPSLTSMYERELESRLRESQRYDKHIDRIDDPERLAIRGLSSGSKKDKEEDEELDDLLKDDISGHQAPPPQYHRKHGYAHHTGCSDSHSNARNFQRAGDEVYLSKDRAQEYQRAPPNRESYSNAERMGFPVGGSVQDEFNGRMDDRDARVPRGHRELREAMDVRESDKHHSRKYPTPRYKYSPITNTDI